MVTLSPQQSQFENHKKLFLEAVEPEFSRVFRICSPRSNHSLEVLYSTWSSALYICRAEIPGTLLELGVWRGGTLGCMGLAVSQYGAEGRDVCGIDTFDGYPPPEEDDRDIHGNSMLERFRTNERGSTRWGAVNLEEVAEFCSACLTSTRLIPALIDETFRPSHYGLEKVSFLRLDLNWRQPTTVALRELWPLVPIGGVVQIVAGHHLGAKQAVSDWLVSSRAKLNFVNVNYSTIVATKTHD
jgi:O-methyltransferase